MPYLVVSIGILNTEGNSPAIISSLYPYVISPFKVISYGNLVCG